MHLQEKVDKAALFLHEEEVRGSNPTTAHSSGHPDLTSTCRPNSPDPVAFFGARALLGRRLGAIRLLSWYADAGDGDVFMVFSLICNHAEES